MNPTPRTSTLRRLIPLVAVSAAFALSAFPTLAQTQTQPQPATKPSIEINLSPEDAKSILLEASKTSSTFTPAADAPFLPAKDAFPPTISPVAAPGRSGIIHEILPPEGSKVLRFRSARLGYDPDQDPSADRALTDILGPDWKTTHRPDFEGRGSMHFRFDFSEPGQPAKRDDRAAFYFQYTSARAAANLPAHTPANQPAPVRIERTWFAFYDPSPSATPTTPRPLVLFIPGVFGTPEPICNTLIARLRKEGYPVLRMLAHPSRFTQSELYAIDPENIDETVRLAAAEISLRAAECAQSSRDALAYVESRRPALAGTSVIGIGFSGGAMVMPTVLALQPERFSAAVMVGGGADWWLIQSRSNYAGWIDALRVAWTNPPTEAQERQADAAYLNAAPLDAYHTAAVLKNSRTLIIQGDADLAVPSNLGDLLWERAGRPERWLDHSSHESLFLGLPLQFDRLMQWLASPAPDVPAR